ncbi:MAG: DNA-directed RNA polymerase subunit alpha [Holosporales bacterium]|nr:DNA-directed RNA polymerase subunit alpha [Holosporales bacterium]
MKGSVSVVRKQWQDLIKPYKLQMEAEGAHCCIATVVAEPLERGFGVTLGNSLRRVLLSSLTGAAVTSVKIEGVLHEFSVLPGVLEDVTDIVLNVKELKLASSATGPQRLFVSAVGPCEVRASMIETGGMVTVLDPDHLICTLDTGAKFSMEMAVETGRGYVPADKNRTDEMPIGTLPVDAIFSPVRKVSYKVDNTRVGNATDYDKLTLIVETNGATSPEDAITIAARTLQDQLQQFVNCNLEEQEMTPDISMGVAIPCDPNLLRRIEELEFSVRVLNCLKGENIVYVGDLVQFSEYKMLRTPNFGRKSLNEIKEVLARMDLALGMEVPGWPPENIDDLAQRSHEGFC